MLVLTKINESQFVIMAKEIQDNLSYSTALKNYNESKKITDSLDKDTLNNNDKVVNSALKTLSEKDPSLHEYLSSNKKQFEAYKNDPDKYLNTLEEKIKAADVYLNEAPNKLKDLGQKAAKHRETNPGIQRYQKTMTEVQIEHTNKIFEDVNKDRYSSVQLLNNLKKYKDIEQDKALQSTPDKIKNKVNNIKQALTKVSATVKNKAQGFISKKPVDKNKGPNI